MTDRPEDQMPDEIEALAAEYALGLLDAPARAAVEARLRVEPALARAVADWQARFAAMAEAEVAPVPPPPRVQAALEARLFGPAPARLWDGLGFWRGLSALSTAVAAVAVGVAILPDSQPPALVPTPGQVPDLDSGAIPPGTILLTHLVPIDGSGLGLAATRDPDGRLQLRRVAGGPTPGRAQQAWLIPAPDAAPIPLGLLGDEPLTVLAPPPEVAALFGAGAAVAISDEPPGGSPTGQPTGAILALGTLVAL
jgi:anti-sigma-K factor RskA